MPHTHDGPVHLARIASYYKELSYGQVPVRWASELNFGVGMPLFNFMYHLPYLIASFFVFLSFSLVTSFKITLLISFLLSGLGMFLFSNKLFGDIRRAYLITLLYQFAPFHLVELVVRGSVGEAYTYSFLPFILYGMLLLKENPNARNSIYVSISTSLLILSHNAISLISFAVASLFALWIGPKAKHRVLSIASLFIGLGLTTFYWLPAVLERKYTYGDLFMKTMYLSHFAPFTHFFIPNFTNDASLQTGGITVYLGLIQSVLLVASLYLLLRKKIHDANIRSMVYFGMCILVVSFFFMQPISKGIWAHLSVLRMFQFPWRLLSVVGLATALFGGIMVLKKKKETRIIIALSIITVFSTIIFWSPPLGFDKIHESDYWNYSLNTTYFGETDLIWSDGPASTYPFAPFELIAGNANISNIYKKSIHHSFTIDAQTPVRILDNTQYFPGWRVFVDGKKTPIEFQDQNHRGRITFGVPAGIHTIQIDFGNSPIRTIGNILSLITLIFSSLLYILISKKNKNNS